MKKRKAIRPLNYHLKGETLDTLYYKPFYRLAELLSEKIQKKNRHKKFTTLKLSMTWKDENRLFLEAMSDVTPINNSFRQRNFCSSHFKISPKKVKDEVVAALETLIREGKDFRIADTPEYMEGLGAGVHKGIAQMLHAGFFSYQDYIDLHGYNTEDAYEIFNAFMKESVKKGLRCVLIIHGRGISSPDVPKLKMAVKEWLTMGYWRKWLVAFTSAKNYEGGSGATYVLLRKRPLKNLKKYFKQQ